MQFTQPVRDALTEAGWHEGRSINPMPYVEDLRNDELEVHDAAVDFYRQFGELRIRTAPDWYHGALDLTVDSCWHGTAPILEALAKVVGLLCPIGYYSFSRLELRVDPSGGVYGYDDVAYGLVQVAASPHAAIEYLIAGHKFRRILPAELDR